MGYPGLKGFDHVFIKRTKELLCNTSTEFDFTLLINTLVGLLILPVEFYKRMEDCEFNPFNKKIRDIKDIKIRKIFNNTELTILKETKEIKIKKCIIRDNDGNEKNIDDTLFSEILLKMRNSIAHFHITPTRDDNENWEGILLQNYNDKDIATLDLYITETELKDFTFYLCEKYERCIRPKNKL